MRQAVRQFVKTPGFTAVALLTLALGIGVNTTTFTLVDFLLYRVPVFARPGRIVRIVRTTPQSQFGDQSPADVRDESEQSTLLQDFAIYCFNAASLVRPGETAERVPELQVGGGFFQVVRVPPLLGRLLTPADARPGRDNVVVVSEDFWKERLGGRADAVGAVLRLDGRAATVVGVLPQSAQDPFTWGAIDLWKPLGYGGDTWRIRDNPWLQCLAVLKPGATLGAAQAEMSGLAARLAREHPETNANSGLHLDLYERSRVNDVTRKISWLMLGLMFAVLLIACVNLANLQLARNAARTREYAVRIALGASRRRLIGQLLGESLLLSLAGGAFGLLVAVWGNELLGSRIEIDFFHPGKGIDLPLDPRVIAFLAAVSVATGIVFGLMPAWMASQTDITAGLKHGGKGSSPDRSRHRLRHALVVAELALALALLAGAAYFVRGVQRMNRIDPGWRTENLLSGNFVLSYNTYTSDRQLQATVGRLRARLEAIPGVERAAIAGNIPIFGYSRSGGFVIDGQPRPERGKEPLASVERATPGFFATLGIPLVAGRDFTDADRADSRPVAIVNESMARKFWPRGDAIGHRIGGGDPARPDWREIVGIVKDVAMVGSLGPPPTPFQTYHPFDQDSDHWLALCVRARGDAGALSGSVRQAVARIDPDLAVYGLATVEETLDRAGRNMGLVEWILGLAAVLGLFLSLVGVYGVIANLTAQRSQEIGIRMALGAQAGTVLWLVLRSGARLAGIGIGLGLALALLLTRGIGLAMPEIPGQDPLLVVLLAVLLAGATLVACWLPARRATKVDPVEALRAE